ncbi:MAG TPA: HAMP domain-containing sensor histidine kinase, partial [Abditibacterium sp.]
MKTHSEDILVLTATTRDAMLAARSLESNGVCAHICPHPHELERALAEGAGALLLAEEACSAEVLGVLEAWLEAQPPWSDLPLIFLQVAGAGVESPLIAQLRQRGNLSLLERPLRQSTLFYAIETALRARRRQYQVRDLLEEKEADVRRRDEFLAMLGHELRNPLAAIRYAIRLLSEIDQSAETRTPREVIGRQTNHLAHLVDDLLDVARVTRGKIALDLKPLDLNEMGRKTLQTIESAHHDGMGQSRHHLSFRPAPHPLFIEGDAVRIEQIFSNLLFNAIKYTPPGGHIDFSLQRQGDQAVMRLQDDGIGMSPELLERVFDLFSQAQHTIDRSRGGLGIGLTLVRGLVELHGGRIVASSAGLGQGSCFEVSFPVLEAAV